MATPTKKPTISPFKTREAETKKVPYMAICGKRGEKSSAVSVRRHGGGELGLIRVEELGRIIQSERKDNFCV